MRHLTFIIAIIFTVLLTDCKKNDTSVVIPKVDTIPMLVTQIQKCSRLYTTECHLHKIITHDDKVSVQGQFMKHDYNIDLPLGNRKIAIPMDAVVKAYIDFSTFDSTSVRRQGNRIEIVLPDPKVQLISTSINHKDIKQYVALTRSRFSDEELTSYERQGRDEIIKVLPSMNLTSQAQESAANILIPMLTKAGFKEADITITFRKGFNPNNITSLMETNTDHGRRQ